MDILYCDPHLVVALKPAGISAEADGGRGDDLPTLLTAALRARGEKEQLFVVHRLDRAVGGLTVLARTKAAAASLGAAVGQKDGFCKDYFAVIQGQMTPAEGRLQHYLRRDGLRGRAVPADSHAAGAKRAELLYRTLAEAQTDTGTPITAVAVRLCTGRFHQIRAQFAFAGHPLVGDGKYGAAAYAPQPALFAASLSFLHPADGRPLSFFAPPPEAYPFSVFPKNTFTPLSFSF